MYIYIVCVCVHSLVVHLCCFCFILLLWIMILYHSCRIFLDWTCIVSPLDIYLGSEITASYGNLCLTFWGNAKLFSTAVASFYILTNSGQGLSLSTYLSVFVIFFSLKKPQGVWSGILFWLAFLQWQICEPGNSRCSSWF